VLTELERLLREPGCPACRFVGEAQRSFFSWFEIESFSTVEVQARLRAGMGMCRAHSRRLIEEIGEGHIMTTVAREALAGARQTLRGDGPLGSCCACDAVASAWEHANHMLVDGLLDSTNARRYSEHQGMCLPHVLEAAPTADPSVLKLLAERLLASLRTVHERALLELLAGVDSDAPRRARWREALPEETIGGSTVERLCSLLAIDACPVCLAAGLIDRRYVRCVLERSREGDQSVQNDPGELCFIHLHDAALANGAAIGGAIERKRQIRIAELRRLLDRLADLPPTMGRRRRGGGLVDLDRAREEFVGPRYCPACHARDGIERSQLELVTAALALSPVRERYECSHGLCIRHAMQLSDGQIARLVKRHADARVGVLAWEVQETARKYAWAYRHEVRGPERDAWLRALAQVEGDVIGGAPAPAPSRDEPA
jgi:hypothetical protein